MNIKSPSKSKGIDFVNEQQMQKNKIQVLIEHWETKIKQMQKRISQKEVRLESMESHSDYEYKDLLRESNESEKDHKKDLKLLIDLLCKYNIVTR
jgi:hypothetical protein